MFESKSGVFLIAGIGFFLLAFVSNALVPILMYRKLPEQTVQQTIEAQLASHREGKRSYTILNVLRDLKTQYAEPFKTHFGEIEPGEKGEVAIASKMLREGRGVYVAEACWHCHSQFVRPVSNEEKRWGPVSRTWEYQNELQRPVLFGTRRVGPDLSREGGRRSNDWHAVHFYRPKWTSPESVMPEYPWFFDGDPGRPNRRGLSLILYIQWLGSQLDTFPRYNTGESSAASDYRGWSGAGVD